MQTEESSFLVESLILVIRLILGGIFVYAGIPKILNPAAFAEAVYNYQILPGFLINFVAIVLPWMEVVVGGLLITGLWLPGALFSYILLMTSFIAALSFNVVRGLDIHCGCFSVEGGHLINIWTVVRDFFFLVPALFLFWTVVFRKRRKDSRAAL